MAASTVRALVPLALLAVARAQRFGDRLAPRVPASYVPRVTAAAHAQHHVYDDERYEPKSYDDTTPAATAADTDILLERPAHTEAHRLQMSTEYFMVPPRSTETVKTVRPSTTPRTASPPTLPASSTVSSEPTNNLTRRGTLRSEAWATPILALACVCMVAVCGFEAFVVWGARRTAPSRRHLLLGQTLLFGLFACAATAALIAVTPTVFTCGAIRFGTGVSYAVVFASLLVKCVFLLSLNGGVYLPAAYQALLLFFAVMIQVAIGAQWLGNSPPRVTSAGCDTSLSDLLLSLCYAAFLIAVVCGVALRSRGIRDNYREATHIAAAAGASAAVWACWVAAGLGTSERHRDACVAAGLLATCVFVFTLMFAPKGRRLAALGREGRWDTDRDEGVSSLGGAGSGYSPSFFHFKPVKYGMVSGMGSVPVPAPLDRKEPATQQADPTGALALTGTTYPHATRAPYYQHYSYLPHPFLHYHYSHMPYHYLLPPGAVVRPEEGPYTCMEPTFSSNPNVYFQRSEPIHVGMMY